MRYLFHIPLLDDLTENEACPPQLAALAEIVLQCCEEQGFDVLSERKLKRELKVAVKNCVLKTKQDPFMVFMYYSRLLGVQRIPTAGDRVKAAWRRLNFGGKERRKHAVQ